MNDKYLKTKTTALTTEMNHFWTGILVTFGGVIGFTTLQSKNI